VTGQTAECFGFLKVVRVCVRNDANPLNSSFCGETNCSSAFHTTGGNNVTNKSVCFRVE